jgi:alpha-glucosidase
VLVHYRRALAFRREHPALVTGAIEFLEAEGDVLALVRSGQGEKLVCVLNFASAAAQWAVPEGLGELEIVESRGARLDASTLALGGLSSCFARIGLP